MQRDRDLSDYLDFEAHYEQRPSVWVEPVGDWGKGVVELVEIPSDQEIHDNVVAYWISDEKVTAGQELRYAYNLHWFSDLPVEKIPGAVTATRTGIGGVSGQQETEKRKFVIDFDILNMQEEVEKGIAVLETSASEGKIVQQQLVYNPTTGGLTFSIPVSVLSSREESGLKAKKHKYFIIPEELNTPSVLQKAQRSLSELQQYATYERGVIDVISDSDLNALHILMLPVNGPAPDFDEAVLKQGRIKLENFINYGVKTEFTKEEEIALLYSPDFLETARLSYLLNAA